MTKEALRQEYKAKRTALHTGERLRMDDLMLLQFQQFDFSTVETLFSYWPIDTHGEPNTHLFSGYLRHMVPGITIAYPVTDENAISMTALAIHEDTVYHTNEWGITEPKEGYVLLPEQIDMVLVPLLVFDQKGYRVGYGKGFYDRYLSRCRKEVISIGFSYFDPVDKISDTDQFDVPLSYCITPQKTYEF